MSNTTLKQQETLAAIKLDKEKSLVKPEIRIPDVIALPTPATAAVLETRRLKTPTSQQLQVPTAQALTVSPNPTPTNLAPSYPAPPGPRAGTNEVRKSERKRR
jgi:hypothetical protein